MTFEPRVVIGIDDNYLVPAVLFIERSHRLRSREIIYTVLYMDRHLTPRSIAIILSLSQKIGASVHFTCLSGDQLGPEYRHISSTGWARLHPEAIGASFVWFDVDLIPFRGWDSIFDEKSLDTHAVSAAIDPWVVKANSATSEHNQAVVRARDRYFNSGVLGLNFGLWQRKRLGERVKKAMASYEELGLEWGDQCVANFTLAGTQGDLPSCYNHFSGERKISPIRLVHFPGPWKPWDFQSAVVSQPKTLSRYWFVYFWAIIRFRFAFPQTADALSSPNLRTTLPSTVDLVLWGSKLLWQAARAKLGMFLDRI